MIMSLIIKDGKLVLQKVRPDWNTLNFEIIQEWCEQFSKYYEVQDELADVGKHCELIDDMINMALLQLKKELDKMELIEE